MRYVTMQVRRPGFGDDHAHSRENTTSKQPGRNLETRKFSTIDPNVHGGGCKLARQIFAQAISRTEAETTAWTRKQLQ
jgi:hypothetical protein